MTGNKGVPDYLEDIVTHPHQGADTAYEQSENEDDSEDGRKKRYTSYDRFVVETQPATTHLCTHDKHAGTCPACLDEGKS